MNEGFSAFWSIYPRKIARRYCEKLWVKLNPSTELSARIVQSVEEHIMSEWQGRSRDKIPHPSTFLNQGRWEDEIPAGSAVVKEWTGDEVQEHLCEGWCTTDHLWLCTDEFCCGPEKQACPEFIGRL